MRSLGKVRWGERAHPLMPTAIRVCKGTHKVPIFHAVCRIRYVLHTLFFFLFFFSPALCLGFQPPAHSPSYNYDPQPAHSAAAPLPSSGGVRILSITPFSFFFFFTCLVLVLPNLVPLFLQKRYRAVYDYAAADEDEVSFADGDLIVDVQQIDEGWMFGRVERTGQQGMLPANYVEAI